MKKLMSILVVGMMLIGVLGPANATVKQWTSVKNTKLGANGYTVNHTLGGFNAGDDWLQSHTITLTAGKSSTTVGLSSDQISKLYKNGKVSFRVADKFGGTQIKTKLVAWGQQGGGNGGGNNTVPEPGMLALMAFVLLGLGLGPWLRKIRT